MEKNEETNPWANPPNEIEDILLKEVFPRLKWDDILNLTVCKVNKAWRALFTKNNLWKSVIQRELPFIDTTDTKDYCKKFFDSVESFKIIRCAHPGADVSTAVRACPCMLPIDLNTADEHVLYYTGNQYEFILKKVRCNCDEKVPSREYLQFPLICKECHESIKDSVDFVGRKGSPEAKRKWGNGIWIHKEFQLAEEILVAKPVPNSPNLYVAITKTELVRKLVLLTINGDKVEQADLAEVSGDTTALQVSNDGKFVAAYAEKGMQGFVYNLETRANSFEFTRTPYQVQHSSFPVAFITYENKEYLIAGRAWNKLDLFDPETGESLKERDVTNNHLEFFWCKLHVSPDQKNLCSFGWVWHPIGVCAKFSIENWMKGDLYAMEKSKTVTEGYDWDYPMCWLDNDTLAIWGDSTGSMDHHGLPVVHSVSVNPSNENNTNTDQIQREPLWVPLGESPLVFDEYLFSLNPQGVEVIDVSDSHVLDIANKQSVDRVLCYNKHSKQVVSIKHNDQSGHTVLVLSHIHFNDKQDV